MKSETVYRGYTEEAYETAIHCGKLHVDQLGRVGATMQVDKKGG